MKKPFLGKQVFPAANTEIDHEEKIKEYKNIDSAERPLYTGRYFVILKDGYGDITKVDKLLASSLGIKVAHTNDFKSVHFNESMIEGADALLYDELGLALVGGVDEQIQLLQRTDPGFIFEPEKVVYLPNEGLENMELAPAWGLAVTQALNSDFAGREVKVAVLDTGFDKKHPDFNGRNITADSMVPEESATDVHGHGTHCIGTACGYKDAEGIRYGVAYESLIYAGKVLSNQGSGAQAWIINGIDWAARNGCKVVSISFGSRVFPGQGYDLAYERAAKAALSKGAIVVAAAGNESNRSSKYYNPVGSPADCPSILAVGAIDADFKVADFSNRTINPSGTVDIAGPGVKITSSWPMPIRYRTISGTSMATPHVAGILAMLWEKYPSSKPQDIIAELRKLAKALPLPETDVGVGLATAP